MRTIITFFNNLLLPIIPESKGFGFKRFMWRLAGARIGRNVKISSSCKILGAGQLSIGDNTWIGYQCLLVASSKIEIGANVDIAPRVYIGTGTHTINPEANHIASEDISRDVQIGDGSWICVNAVILPGCSIGRKTVVAAGSVVASSFMEDKILVGGIPARKIKTYGN